MSQIGSEGFGYSVIQDEDGLWTARLYIGSRVVREVFLCSSREQAFREVCVAMYQVQAEREVLR